MTLPMYLMLAAAVFSALSWRWNPTAAALAFAYFTTQLWWLLSGRGLDAGEMFMIDVLVVGLILCKAITRCPDMEFVDFLDQLRCFLLSPTLADRIVLGIFPLMWAVYVLRIDEHNRWWTLFALAMAQFIAAGGESLSEWRKANAPNHESDIPSSGSLRYALTRARGYG